MHLETVVPDMNYMYHLFISAILQVARSVQFAACVKHFVEQVGVQTSTPYVRTQVPT